MKNNERYAGLYKRDNTVHTAEFLKELQSLPLERKIAITSARIMEFVRAAGGPQNVVISDSGGKDSAVLVHIARQLFPDIECVYADTGLEYPEVRKKARDIDGATIVRPKMSFPEVITEYGYPLVSKEVAEAIYYARRVKNAPGADERERERRATQDRKRSEMTGTRQREDAGT